MIDVIPKSFCDNYDKVTAEMQKGPCGCRSFLERQRNCMRSSQMGKDPARQQQVGH